LESEGNILDGSNGEDTLEAPMEDDE